MDSDTSIEDILFSKEEIEYLKKDSRCLNCNHKKIFHIEYDAYGSKCAICNCRNLMIERDYEYWNARVSIL